MKHLLWAGHCDKYGGYNFFFFYPTYRSCEAGITAFQRWVDWNLQYLLVKIFACLSAAAQMIAQSQNLFSQSLLQEDTRSPLCSGRVLRVVSRRPTW